MGTPTNFRRLLFALTIMVFLAASISRAEIVANFVGSVECTDCVEKNIKKENAVEGLHINIKCKVDKETYETKAKGDIDNQGNFQVELPKQLIDKEGKLKEECYAELLSATNTPCNDNASPSKLIFESQQEEKHTFVPETGKIHFSTETCVSAFFWLHHFHKHFPWFKKPLPNFHFTIPHKHYYPTPVYKSPIPVYKPPTYTPIPVYKPPVYTPTPPVPVYKPPVYQAPPTPVYTPPPTPVYKPPVYKSPTPVYKPPVYTPPVHKTPVYKPPVYSPPVHKTPVYKPPVYSPPVHKTPVYKPPVYTPPVHKPPVYKPPVYTPPVSSPPVYKPPVYKPPVYTPTPVYKPPSHHKHPKDKKPCPPIPLLPPLHHKHPKHEWPTLPPYSPHPWKKDFGHKHPIVPPV